MGADILFFPARVVGAGRSLKNTGAVAGTVVALPDEQALGEELRQQEVEGAGLFFLGLSINHAKKNIVVHYDQSLAGMTAYRTGQEMGILLASAHEVAARTVRGPEASRFRAYRLQLLGCINLD